MDDEGVFHKPTPPEHLQPPKSPIAVMPPISMQWHVAFGMLTSSFAAFYGIVSQDNPVLKLPGSHERQYWMDSPVCLAAFGLVSKGSLQNGWFLFGVPLRTPNRAPKKKDTGVKCSRRRAGWSRGHVGAMQSLGLKNSSPVLCEGVCVF